MKKYWTILFCGLTLALGACSLNIDIEDEIAGDDAIDNVAVAREALNDAYYTFPKHFMDLSMLAEDFFPTALMRYSANTANYYKWREQEMIEISEGLWRNYYAAVTSINILLASEKYIGRDTAADKTAWETIKGEAYALKALIYFELLNLYSDRYAPDNRGIILKERFGAENSPQSLAKDCLLEVKTLLADARGLLEDKEYDGNYYYRLNHPAVLLLSARVALYEGDTDGAAQYCRTLLAERGFASDTPNASDYAKLWENSPSTEKLFAFWNENQMNTSYYNYSALQGDIIAVPDVFDYDRGDVRYGVATLPFEMKRTDGTTPVTYNLMGKYRTAVDDYEYVNLNCLRLAEAYFILAECEAAEGHDDDARKTINFLLRRRGAEEIEDYVDGDDLMERIMLEKQKEFVGEGINYFDLKRTGRSMRRFAADNSAGVEESVIAPDDHRWLLPLPLGELRENRGTEQNPKWPGII